jgi:hypothetical protein
MIGVGRRAALRVEQAAGEQLDGLPPLEVLQALLDDRPPAMARRRRETRRREVLLEGEVLELELAAADLLDHAAVLALEAQPGAQGVAAGRGILGVEAGTADDVGDGGGGVLEAELAALRRAGAAHHRQREQRERLLDANTAVAPLRAHGLARGEQPADGVAVELGAALGEAAAVGVDDAQAGQHHGGAGEAAQLLAALEGPRARGRRPARWCRGPGQGRSRSRRAPSARRRRGPRRAEGGDAGVGEAEALSGSSAIGRLVTITWHLGQVRRMSSRTVKT